MYFAALADGYTPSTQVLDLPVNLNGWSPRNSDGTFSGAMTLTESLARSVNTIAVRLQQHIGSDVVAQTARDFGIQSELRVDPTMALGTSEVTPVELTAAYAMLANGGAPVTPHVISRIRTHLGRVLFAHKPVRPGRAVEGPTVGHMNAMLRDVVKRGTGRRASFPRHDIAGKTGTTQHARDAWFVGFTSHLTAGVWVGVDDGRATQKLSGAKLPAMIFRDVMSAAHSDLPAQPLVWTVETDSVSTAAATSSGSENPMLPSGWSSTRHMSSVDLPVRNPKSSISQVVSKPTVGSRPGGPSVTAKKSRTQPFNRSAAAQHALHGTRHHEADGVVVPTTTIKGIRRDADRGPLNALIEKIKNPSETRLARDRLATGRMSLGAPLGGR